MSWKYWNTRIMETIEMINSKMGPSKGAIVQTYINGLTVPDRKLLSAAMAQGDYAANPQGQGYGKG